MQDHTAEKLGFDTDRLERVGQGLRDDIGDGRCHGVALVVARGGETVLEVVDGWADKAGGRTLDRDAVFVTLSSGKQFTNVLALALVERGVLRLHAPVCELIPEFGALGKEKVNLYHLLTHTSGLQSAIPTVPVEVATSIAKSVQYACGLALESLPGERVNYSITLAHYVIAELCLRAAGNGRTFAEMMAQEIFEPLGMTSTCLGGRDDLLGRLCPVKPAYSGIPALIAPEGVEMVGELVAMPGAEIPAGGYLTTLGDLYRFAEMLRCGGELGGQRILAPATIEFCTRNHSGSKRNVLFDPCLGYRNWDAFPANIGVGFFVRGEGIVPGPFGAFNSPGTFGGIGAGSTAFLIDPARDLTMAFLSTGLMEDSYHLERLGRISDQVVSAIVT